MLFKSDTAGAYLYGVNSRAPIMLLEDDPNDVLFVELAVAQAQILNPVLVFVSAEDARDHLTRKMVHPPAVFLIDVGLDGPESGVDFLSWLREDSGPVGSTPVLMLTGSVDPAHREATRVLDVVAYLEKPVTSTSFIDALHSVGCSVVTNLMSGGVGFLIERPVACSGRQPTRRTSAPE